MHFFTNCVRGLNVLFIINQLSILLWPLLKQSPQRLCLLLQVNFRNAGLGFRIFSTWIQALRGFAPDVVYL